MRAFLCAWAAVGLLNSGCDDAGDDNVAAVDCQSRCEAKFEQCNQPAAPCSQVCDGTTTEAQLSCFESRRCEQLATGGATECGVQDGSNGGDRSCVCGDFELFTDSLECGGVVHSNCSDFCACIFDDA